jgi:hypothetical protein
MLQLIVAYLLQADREREIETDLRARQRLRLLPQNMGPIEPQELTACMPRRAPVRARAVGR